MSKRSRQFDVFRTPKAQSKVDNLSQSSFQSSQKSEYSRQLLTPRTREFNNELKMSRKNLNPQNPEQASNRNSKVPVGQISPFQKKKLEQVCVGCVNKLISNKKKQQELDRLEHQRQMEKRKLELERQEILKEQMEYIKKMKAEQLANQELAERKKQEKQEQLKKRAEEAHQDLQKLNSKYFEEEAIWRQNEQEKITKFQRELREQYEAEVRRKKLEKSQVMQEKPKMAIFDEQEMHMANVLRQQSYRHELKQQIQEKNVMMRQTQIKERENQQKYLQEIMQDMPHLSLNQGDQYKGIKEQVEQRNKERQETLARKKEEDARQKEQLEHDIKQLYRQEFEHKMAQMKDYVNDLSRQVQQKAIKRNEERLHRQAPGFTSLETATQSVIDLKACNNCELKFPATQLTSMEI